MSILDDVDDLVLAEEERWERVAGWARDNAQDIALLWRFGDGCGGSFLDRVAREVRGQGYPVETQHEMAERFAAERTTPPRRKIPAKVRTQVFERDLYRCRHCRTHLSLTIDHITPHSRGGTDDLDNLQTLCRSCNSRKGNQDSGGGA